MLNGCWGASKQHVVACAQSPGPPFGSSKPGAGRVVLVRAGSAQGYAEGTLLGTRDDPLSTLGRVHAQKTAELLMDIEVGAPLVFLLFCSCPPQSSKGGL